MNSRTTQLGVRENPAPLLRQHGSRIVASSLPVVLETEENRSGRTVTSPLHDSELATRNANGTTGEVEKDGEGQFLTVHEVASLLRVPASWVYGRTRKRSRERLPAYKLGKYWRFREAEVLAWVESQRRGAHA